MVPRDQFFTPFPDNAGCPLYVDMGSFHISDLCTYKRQKQHSVNAESAIRFVKLYLFRLFLIPSNQKLINRCETRGSEKKKHNFFTWLLLDVVSIEVIYIVIIGKQT